MCRDDVRAELLVESADAEVPAEGRYVEALEWCSGEQVRDIDRPRRACPARPRRRLDGQRDGPELTQGTGSGAEFAQAVEILSRGQLS